MNCSFTEGHAIGVFTLLWQEFLHCYANALTQTAGQHKFVLPWLLTEDKLSMTGSSDLRTRIQSFLGWIPNQNKKVRIPIRIQEKRVDSNLDSRFLR